MAVIKPTKRAEPPPLSFPRWREYLDGLLRTREMAPASEADAQHLFGMGLSAQAAAAKLAEERSR